MDDLKLEGKRSLGLKECNIIQSFRDQGKIDMLDDIQVFKPSDSAHTDIVIFMERRNDYPVAAKVFNHIGHYHEEKESLEKEMGHIQLLNNLRKKHNTCLPYIAQYEGASECNEQGIILLSKAKGTSLKKLHTSLFSMADNRIIKIFETIGKQLGAVDALFFKENNKRLCHPDSHLANFTFDENQNQLYWLDTAGLSIVDTFVPSLKDYNFIGQIEYSVTHDNEEEDYIYLMDIAPLEEKITMRVTIAKRFLALKCLYAGYSSALSDQGVSDQIFDQKMNDINNRPILADLQSINVKLKENNIPEIAVSPKN